MEELVGAAVEVVGRDDLVAHLGDVQQGERGRRLPGGHRQRAGAAFDRGDALLEHVGGRVHDPGVDVPELLQGEQVRRVLGVLEDVGGRLVDGTARAPVVGSGTWPACSASVLRFLDEMLIGFIYDNDLLRLSKAEAGHTVKRRQSRLGHFPGRFLHRWCKKKQTHRRLKEAAARGERRI